ncbi:TPA: hypothetical protein OTT52_004965, partial [Klebsiella michiganensis]|nr:hypothetical protein [Klebsiella michiganensis]
ASRLALRLAGLQVSSRLHADSPDKARQAPPPGRRCRTCCISAAASRLALRLAGLQVSSRLHAVARTRRVKRRLREEGAEPAASAQLLPGSRCA